ncbi:MAG: histidine kinase dimerization/phosphoacceptor domain -containing protein [Pseudomonadota bacterium]
MTGTHAIRPTEHSSPDATDRKALDRKADVRLVSFQHRIINTLQVIASMISLEGRSAARLGSDQGLVLERTRVRIEAIAEVQRRIAERTDLDRIPMCEMVENIVARLPGSLNLAGGVLVECKDDMLDVETATPLALLLLELLFLVIANIESATAVKLRFVKGPEGYDLGATVVGRLSSLGEEDQDAVFESAPIFLDLVQQVGGKAYRQIDTITDDGDVAGGEVNHRVQCGVLFQGAAVTSAGALLSGTSAFDAC